MRSWWRCEACHYKLHDPSEQSVRKQSPFKRAFIAYIASESGILQHADFGAGEHPEYVGYEGGYQKENGYHQIWLSAWIPATPNDIAARKAASQKSWRALSAWIPATPNDIAARKAASQKSWRALSAWIPATPNDIAAVIAVRSDSSYFESHYKKFEEHKDRIEKVFSFAEIKPRLASDSVFHLRVVKKDVDLTQAAERHRFSLVA